MYTPRVKTIVETTTERAFTSSSSFALFLLTSKHIYFSTSMLTLLCFVYNIEIKYLFNFNNTTRQQLKRTYSVILYNQFYKIPDLSTKGVCLAFSNCKRETTYYFFISFILSQWIFHSYSKMANLKGIFFSLSISSPPSYFFGYA